VVNISKRLFLLAAFGLMLSPTPLIIAASSVAQPGSIMGNLLRYRMGLSVADLRVLAAGSPVIKSLDTPVREELAYVGVVYINTPAQHYIDRFRDIEQFESGSGVPQIGKFSSVPRLEDLASLTLPALDVEALSKCRPGDCDVKLSANAMRRFRDEVAWASPNAAAQANEVAREIILDLVSRYQVDGNIALGDYHDGSEPLSVTEQFRSLLTSRTPMPVSVPEFLEYLDDYPHGRPAAAEDFFYWAVVDFGFQQTTRVNHVAIYPLAVGLPSSVAYAIAIKQLYASHYFRTTLELRFLVNDERPSDSRGTYLISITRSRSDLLTGFKGFFLRPIVNLRSRTAVLGYLEHAKRQMESLSPVTP